jgi:DNA gyrase/topoisomerase IV subunit B
MSPIGEHKYLALVEGNSAASGLQSSLGRNGIGYFACRGLPINAFSQSIQKIVQNEEFKTIMSILNLDVSCKEPTKFISFDKILIATDSDADGSHLTSMFLGWFKRFGENLFHENKICKLNIPLVLVVDKNEKVIEHFFNLTDFNNWEKQHSNHKYHIEYWKGLGSISKLFLNQLLDKYGLDYFIETYNLDDDGQIYLNNWLSDKTVNERKEYLKKHQLDINNI